MADWKAALKNLKKQPGESPAPANPGIADLGAAVQASREPPSAPPARYLCLGLDFGTSSTKAVIRVLPSGPAFAIAFCGGNGGTNTYLAPTRLWIGNDGGACLEAATVGGWVEEMKVRLMQGPWAREAAVTGMDIKARPADLAAAYLGLLIRRILEWSKTNVLPSLGGARIVWSLNMGIPARDFDAKEIYEAFLAVARAGWHLANTDAAIDLGGAAKAVDAARDYTLRPSGIEMDMIGVVPEVAAGVASYARSQLRREGAHLFVDVGATTFDSSIFLLQQSGDGELKYVFLSADVDSELGALRLHRHRAREIGRLALAQFAAAEPLKPIPTTAQECIPPKGAVENVDAEFAERCTIKLGAVIARAKNKAPPELSVPEHGPPGSMQVILSGGGVHLPLYRNVIEESGRRAAPGGRQGFRVKPFQTMQVPSPQDLRGPVMTPADWQRLEVAYGLSFQIDDIGDFVPPSALSNPPPLPRRDPGSEFITNDQM